MYSIVFSREASREYDSLAVRIQDQIDQKLTLLEKGDFALLNIDKMHGREDTFRLRAGDYRILYEKTQNILTITIIRVKHRKDVYRGF